jgi:hypothetical protein
MHLRDKIVVLDDFVKWVPYDKGELLCGRYSLTDWHYVVHDIDSDEEWANFLSESTIVRCYVLKLCSSNESIAFVYIIQEDFDGEVVSIHGGGWKTPLMYYRGYILMIKHLLDKGLKVRTYCQLSNPAAIRFSRSVGFVPYRYTSEEVFMWINHKRLTSTKLYKRFYLTVK